MARIENQRTVPIVLIALAALLVVARFIAFVLEEKGGGDGQVRWVPLARAQEIALRTGKPILFDFTAEWCAPCHVLDREVFQDAELASAINEKFVPVRIVDRQREDGKNTPEIAALQKRYGVEAFPTVVFADWNGTQRARIEGYRGADHFEGVMESIH